jgi:tetratricopeptide (TPR) repeat protein
MSCCAQLEGRCGPVTVRGGLRLLWTLALLLAGQLHGWMADLEEARQAFISGHYNECLTAAQAAFKAKEDPEEWGILLMDALLAKGRYPEALKIATNALATDSRSVRLRWTAREVFLGNGDTKSAARMADEIQRSFSTRTWAYRDPPDLVVAGRVSLLAGMDPKMVLDRLYDRVRKANPKLREVYLASGELALEKHDSALAARLFQDGLKQLPDDPDLHFGLARAYAPSDPKQMLASLDETLERNTNHVGSLLLLADHSIDAEDYDTADKLLTQVELVNPWQPDAWAYRAVIAHLKNRAEAETEARAKALKFWSENPRVDYLIGRKLSQKYRFSIGANHQKQALAFDPDYLPAKSQLAEDLLRLGQEAEGWRFADEVQHQDTYDVQANNLMALHDVIAKFQTLTNDHFALRMSPHEAALYGRHALELLEKARNRLVPKYGTTLDEPTLVEVFNDEKDFAVRTFGMPDNDGFLGVCFGSVITANSPGSRAGRHFNWESVLWHEFCHVVTLQLTHNKMPRWLSEGISVYEERQAEPSWGEHLNPRYRSILLGSELTPVSQLSGAFLAPKSNVHLQFAYYESCLVVQFLVERFGQEKLAAILRDLGQDAEINDALAKNTLPMARLEKDFESFAHETAQQMAPGLDWEKPAADLFLGIARPHAGADASDPLGDLDDDAWTAWAKTHPTNYWVLDRQTDQLIEQKKWSEAKPLLEKLVELYPDSRGDDSAYRKLASACRALGETNAERQVLARFAEKDDEATDAYMRLMELASTSEDWPAMLRNAQRYIAVNPLLPAPYRYLARASDASGQPKIALQAYRALLELDPSDPADVHFNLGRLLHQAGSPEARRHVLQALEEAPRYRAALQLLFEIESEAPKANAEGTKTAAMKQ